MAEVREDENEHVFTMEVCIKVNKLKINRSFKRKPYATEHINIHRTLAWSTFELSWAPALFKYLKKWQILNTQSTCTHYSGAHYERSTQVPKYVRIGEYWTGKRKKDLNSQQPTQSPRLTKMKRRKKNITMIGNQTKKRKK